MFYERFLPTYINAIITNSLIKTHFGCQFILIGILYTLWHDCTIYNKRTHALKLLCMAIWNIDVCLSLPIKGSSKQVLSHCTELLASGTGNDIETDYAY